MTSMKLGARPDRLFRRVFQFALGLGMVTGMFACSTTPEKLQWSAVLPDKYANCVSERMPIGTPYPGPKNAGAPTVRCKKDSDGYLVGDTLDGRGIDDSDAVRACWKMGGRLPSAAELAKMTDSEPTQKPSDIYWSSTIHSSPSRSLAYVKKMSNGATTTGKYRADLLAVRCVMP